MRINGREANAVKIKLSEIHRPSLSSAGLVRSPVVIGNSRVGRGESLSCKREKSKSNAGVDDKSPPVIFANWRAPLSLCQSASIKSTRCFIEYSKETQRRRDRSLFTLAISRTTENGRFSLSICSRSLSRSRSIGRTHNLQLISACDVG